MDEAELRVEIDELAAAVMGNIWLSVATTAALVDAGAAPRETVLKALGAFAEMLRAEDQHPSTIMPLETAAKLIEASAGPLGHTALIDFHALRQLLRRLGDRGSPSNRG